MSKFEGPKSSLDRIVTEHPEILAREEAKYAQRFADQNLPELRGLERPPTPEELHVFDLANRATNKILARYGLTDFDVPAQNVHLVPESKWAEATSHYREGARDLPGFTSPAQQAIIMKEASTKSLLASELTHEMTHFKSFQSRTVADVNDEARTYRGVPRRFGLGLKTSDGLGTFGLMNEAVITELEKRVLGEVLADPLFRSEVGETARVLRENPGLPNSDDIFVAWQLQTEAGAPSKYQRNTRGYQRARAVLNKLIDALYQFNQDDFQSREAVFDLFGGATMTGRLLPLARVIEKTFGPGAFRQLGECRTTEDLETFAKEIKV